MAAEAEDDPAECPSCPDGWEEFEQSAAMTRPEGQQGGKLVPWDHVWMRFAELFPDDHDDKQAYGKFQDDTWFQKEVVTQKGGTKVPLTGQPLLMQTAIKRVLGFNTNGGKQVFECLLSPWHTTKKNNKTRVAAAINYLIWVARGRVSRKGTLSCVTTK